MQSPIQWIWDFFPSGGVGVRSNAADASSSLPPSSAEVKNKWCCISTPCMPTLWTGTTVLLHVWLNFFTWILSKHLALANGIIGILTRLCTGKPSNFGLISDQNIQTGCGANPVAYSMAKASEWPSVTT
jgi:hypothetical protein